MRLFDGVGGDTYSNIDKRDNVHIWKTARIVKNETPKRDIFKVSELSILRSVNQVTIKTSFYIMVSFTKVFSVFNESFSYFTSSTVLLILDTKC